MPQQDRGIKTVVTPIAPDKRGLSLTAIWTVIMAGTECQQPLRRIERQN